MPPPFGWTCHDICRRGVGGASARCWGSPKMYILGDPQKYVFSAPPKTQNGSARTSGPPPAPLTGVAVGSGTRKGQPSFGQLHHPPPTAWMFSVDGRNPPPKKAWNDDSRVNTHQQLFQPWFQSGAKCILSIHSRGVANEMYWDERKPQRKVQFGVVPFPEPARVVIHW